MTSKHLSAKMFVSASARCRYTDNLDEFFALRSGQMWCIPQCAMYALEK